MPFPSRAFSHAHVFSHVLFDGLRKKERLLAVYLAEISPWCLWIFLNLGEISSILPRLLRSRHDLVEFVARFSTSCQDWRDLAVRFHSSCISVRSRWNSTSSNGDYCLYTQNRARCEKELKDNKDNSLHLGQKYAQIFVLEQIMSVDKYLSIFPRQMFIVYLKSPSKWTTTNPAFWLATLLGD